MTKQSSTKLVSLREVAIKLQISEAEVRQLVQRGKLKSVAKQVHGRGRAMHMFRATDVEAYAAQRNKRPLAPKAGFLAGRREKEHDAQMRALDDDEQKEARRHELWREEFVKSLEGKQK